MAEPKDAEAAPTNPVPAWNSHRARAGSFEWNQPTPPTDTKDARKHIEPWIAALLQAEHVNLLVGSGLSTAVAHLADCTTVDMALADFECELADAVASAAKQGAESTGRGAPNVEDGIRAARELISGLRIINQAAEKDDFAIRASQLLGSWETCLDERLRKLLRTVLAMERGVNSAVWPEVPDTEGIAKANHIRRLLSSFILTFASRAATRERLHIFTTNYDRLLEFTCDLLGLRVLDRFVGGLKPVFQASRLGVDLHYNPPGIRGEPRYLEGVVRFSKLHGSIDWRQEAGTAAETRIVRAALPFGAAESHPDLPAHPRDGLIVYPNPAKDMETLEYPYAELFRDLAAAACQPNSVVITYGYGFGDDHINRILRDTLTIPSSHLAILSYDDASGRIWRFCDGVGRDEQITLLVGNHFGDLGTLVEHYLPKPAIDRTTWRMVELVNRRGFPHQSEENRHAARGAVDEDEGAPAARPAATPEDSE